MRAQLRNLIDAINGVQDWKHTHVGDCIEKAEQAFRSEKLDQLALNERQITCFMEHDIHTYGALQCDYNSALIDIHRHRAEIEAGAK